LFPSQLSPHSVGAEEIDGTLVVDGEIDGTADGLPESEGPDVG